jgi:uncharacterized membrane protein YecN with MAPEG domain
VSAGLPGTGLYAGLAAMLLVVLTLRVVALRRSLRVGIGTGQQPELARAIRVHGNFVEYTPLALLLLALVEAGGASPLTVHAAGALLITSRLLHAWGLSGSTGTSAGRFLGMVGTLLVLLGLAVRLVLQGLSVA